MTSAIQRDAIRKGTRFEQHRVEEFIRAYTEILVVHDLSMIELGDILSTIVATTIYGFVNMPDDAGNEAFINKGIDAIAADARNKVKVLIKANA